MGNETIAINVERQNNREWFTDGDLVCGRIGLSLESGINVRSITATFMCQEVVTVRFLERRVGPGSRSVTGIANVYETKTYDHMLSNKLLFPTSEVAQVATGENLKIAPGVHEFDFEFQIPNMAAFPPSWKMTDVEVFWGIKVCVEVPKPHRDLDEACRINVLPTGWRPPSGPLISVVDSANLTSHLPGFKRGIGKFFDSEHQKTVPVRIAVSFPKNGIQQSSCPDIYISAETDHPELTKILKFKVLVSAHVYADIDGYVDRYFCQFLIGELVNLSFDSDGKVNLSDKMTKAGVWNFPPLPPTFSTGMFKVTYCLEIEAKFKEALKFEKRTGHTKKICIRKRCNVISPSLIDC